MRTAALLFFFTILLLHAPVWAVGEDGTVAARIAQARRLADASDHEAAIGILEDALIEAKPSDRSTIVGMLKRSYMVMASRAQAGGQSREAARYRDNLEILEKASRKSAGQSLASPVKAAATANQASSSRSVLKGAEPTEAAPKPAASRAAGPPAPSLPRAEPPPLEPAPAALPEPPRLGPPPAAASPDPKTSEPLALPAIPPTDAKPPAALAPERKSAGRPELDSDLVEADRFFRSKQFIQAGERYRALAQHDRLPNSRVEHWAYCRWVAVVAAINAHPRNPREWDAIETEVASIQRLAPGKWYGEYLRGKVAEIRGGKSRARDQVVIRGAEPDEARPSRLKRLFGRPDPTAKPALDDSAPVATPPRDAIAMIDQPLALPEDAGAPAAGAPAVRAPDRAPANINADPSAWQIHETANFRIHHHDADLAARAGAAAETARDRQAAIWCANSGSKPWTPLCDLYLYPDGKQFALATGQPPNSPGFSTISSNGQRVVGRKVNLRADHPQLLTAVLPHEVTHVVLADLFTTTQIPRWADEGIAVLAEPAAERDLRAAELEKPLESGRVFNLARLMTMDYPAPQDWSVYYAQSVSLTRFLVGQAPPAQFIEFVRRAHDDGIEPALREIYQIDGLADLEERWLAHARSQKAGRTASAANEEPSVLRR